MLTYDREWKFYIDGDSQYFRKLSELDLNGYFDIIGGVSELHDCKDDNFWLTSLYFEDETDPEIVWQIGYELMSLYNGIRNIFEINPIKLELKELYHNDNSQKYYQYQKVNINGLLDSPPFISETELERVFQIINQQKNELLFISLATIRVDVYLILKYFSHGIDYVNLYKILETIEELSKITQINIQIDENQKKSFTNTANNYDLSRFNSRHGFKQNIKKNNTPSMNIEDAYAFVSNITKTYLKELLKTLKNKNIKECSFNFPTA